MTFLLILLMLRNQLIYLNYPVEIMAFQVIKKTRLEKNENFFIMECRVTIFLYRFLP